MGCVRCDAYMAYMAYIYYAHGRSPRVGDNHWCTHFYHVYFYHVKRLALMGVFQRFYLMLAEPDYGPKRGPDGRPFDGRVIFKKIV